LLMCLQ